MTGAEVTNSISRNNSLELPAPPLERRLFLFARSHDHKTQPTVELELPSSATKFKPYTRNAVKKRTRTGVYVELKQNVEQTLRDQGERAPFRLLSIITKAAIRSEVTPVQISNLPLHIQEALSSLIKKLKDTGLQTLKDPEVSFHTLKFQGEKLSTLVIYGKTPSKKKHRIKKLCQKLYRECGIYIQIIEQEFEHSEAVLRAFKNNRVKSPVPIYSIHTRSLSPPRAGKILLEPHTDRAYVAIDRCLVGKPEDLLFGHELPDGSIYMGVEVPSIPAARERHFRSGPKGKLYETFCVEYLRHPDGSTAFTNCCFAITKPSAWITPANALDDIKLSSLHPAIQKSLRALRKATLETFKRDTPSPEAQTGELLVERSIARAQNAFAEHLLTHGYPVVTRQARKLPKGILRELLSIFPDFSAETLNEKNAGKLLLLLSQTQQHQIRTKLSSMLPNLLIPRVSSPADQISEFVTAPFKKGVIGKLNQYQAARFLRGEKPYTEADLQRILKQKLQSSRRRYRTILSNLTKGFYDEIFCSREPLKGKVIYEEKKPALFFPDNFPGFHGALSHTPKTKKSRGEKRVAAIATNFNIRDGYVIFDTPEQIDAAEFKHEKRAG